MFCEAQADGLGNGLARQRIVIKVLVRILGFRESTAQRLATTCGTPARRSASVTLSNPLEPPLPDAVLQAESTANCKLCR